MKIPWVCSCSVLEEYMTGIFIKKQEVCPCSIADKDIIGIFMQCPRWIYIWYFHVVCQMKKIYQESSCSIQRMKIPWVKIHLVSSCTFMWDTRHWGHLEYLHRVCQMRGWASIFIWYATSGFLHQMTRIPWVSSWGIQMMKISLVQQKDMAGTWI